MLVFGFITSCTEQQSSKPVRKEDNVIISQEKPRLNIHLMEDCLNFLKGKNFYGDNARIEFHYDGNAYIYSNSDNIPLFTGYITVDQTLGSEGRMVRIHDTFGSEQVIILLLKEDGNLIDMSDYTLYQSR